MIELFKAYMPHKMCLMPDMWLVWTTAFTHSGIFLAYFLFFMVFAMRMRTSIKNEIPVSIFSMCMSIFILFCGIGHLIKVSNIWLGWYAFETLWATATMIISFITIYIGLKNIPIVDGIVREDDRRLTNMSIDFPDRRK